MTKKTWVRIGIVMVITCVMCFSDWSFAADNVNKLEILSVSLNTILGYLAWIWVWFAKLAGTFLTNKWVYGEALGWDALLWKYWNLMKNIANFGLGFYFVYIIFKGLIKRGKDNITKNFKDTIIWILVAGVGIQVSWFFTAAIIDVSTITLSAAGALPSQVLSDNPYMVGKIRKTLSEFVDEQSSQVATGLEITFNDPKQNNGMLVKTDYVPIQNKESRENLVDNLMPNADDISGPLYYIGFSILTPHFITSIGNTDENRLYKTLMNIIIQGGTTIVFTIEMFILCVLALMRVLYLWMFIIMSPIAILLWCIEKSGRKGDNESFLSKIMKKINFTSFFVNVFKPTIAVLCLGISIIFIALMKGVILESADRSIPIKGVTIQSVSDADSDSKDNGNKGDQTYTTTMDNEFLRFTFAHSAKGFMEMILCILSVIIVYFIVKLATMKIGDEEDFVSKTIGKLQDSAGELLGSIPVVPVKGYDKEGNEKTRWIGADSVFDITSGRSKLLEQTVGKYQNKVEMKYEDQNEIVRRWFKNETGHLSSSEKNTIISAMNTGDSQALKKVKQEIDSIKHDNGKGMTLNSQTASNDRFWINQFGGRLTAMSKNQFTFTGAGSNDGAWNQMIRAWETNSSIANIEDRLKAIFDGHPNRVKAYAEFFGLGDINDWNVLKDADISKK